MAGPLELVEFWILELLALASPIVFAISFDTITVTVYLVVVSTIIIFEELLFVKLLVFLGLLVFVVFDVVLRIFLNTCVRAIKNWPRSRPK